MSDYPETGRSAPRDYASLWFSLCRCGGPQPSRDRSRADEHDRDCPYRSEVEGDVKELA